MSDTIITTVISSIVTLVVTFVSLYATIKKDREKQTEEIKKILLDHREEYLSGIQSVKDTVSKMDATVQGQIGIIEYEIKTLSERVDKHNNVIERTYRLEQDSAVQAEQIKALQAKVI